MAKIPTYQEQGVETTPTAKTPIYGSPVGEALGQLGGSIAKVGGVMAQYAQHKEQLETSLVEQKRKNQLEDFDNQLEIETVRLQKENVPIEEYDERLAPFIESAKESINGISMSAPEKYRPALTEQNNFFFNQSVPKRIELAKMKNDLVTKQNDLETQIVRGYARGDVTGTDAIIDANTNILGIEKASQLKNKGIAITKENQTSIGYDRYANRTSIAELDEAATAMKDGSAWVGLDFVDDTAKRAIERTNKSRKTELLKLKADTQNENVLQLEALRTTGGLDFVQLEVLKNQANEWDSPNDGAGISSAQYNIIKKKLNRDIEGTIPTEWETKQETLIKEIAKDQAGGWFSKAGMKLESEKELGVFIDDLSKSKLDPDQQYVIMQNAIRHYNITRNPKISQPVADTVAKLTKMEADCIVAGVPVKLGDGASGFLSSLSKSSTEEQVQQAAEARYNILKPAYEKAIESKLSRREVAQPVKKQESGVFIVDKIYTDDKGNRAKWNGSTWEEVK